MLLLHYFFLHTLCKYISEMSSYQPHSSTILLSTLFSNMNHSHLIAYNYFFLISQIMHSLTLNSSLSHSHFTLNSVPHTSPLNTKLSLILHHLTLNCLAHFIISHTKLSLTLHTKLCPSHFTLNSAPLTLNLNFYCNL